MARVVSSNPDSASPVPVLNCQRGNMESLFVAIFDALGLACGIVSMSEPVSAICVFQLALSEKHEVQSMS